jgi:chromosomal replication initiator protein
LELPAQLEPTAAWHEIRAKLRRAVGESTYDIWLAPLEVKTWDGTELSLQAPPATEAWVAGRFGHILEACARSVAGPATQVSFATARDSHRAATPPVAPHAARPQDFNPRYNFNQFIIGEGNRLAHAASLAVAELPGQAYNPLFLHAPPGLGKTHLLHAIGNYTAAFGGGATIRYTTVEAFTNHFITALGSRSLEPFKRAYRDADVLLIDDVQFLASKAKTEEEFFHTFNAIYEAGRQLVITCDRLPRQLVAVEERLRERFESGLVAEIRPPDFATRVAILRKRADLDRVQLADDVVLELIAERVADNVRTLEGALIRIVAHHSLSGRPLDVELASNVLDRMYPPAARGEIAISDIQSAVAGYYGLSVGELLSPTRAARIAWPRQVAIHLARELTGASLHAVGDAFARSHATILHACRRVSERLIETDDAASEIRELTALITHEQADRTH